MMPNLLPLANDGVFWTIQGEGHLRGQQMTFVRLGGCSVACPRCDTDYRVAERVDVNEIASRAHCATPTESRERWAWITGGEPTDHDLRPLIRALREYRFSVAVATSGHRRMIPPVDWLSVSPHDPAKWVQLFGSELKIVPGLYAAGIEEFLAAHPDSQTDFMLKYVSPLSVKVDDGRFVEDPASLADCLKFLRTHPNWSLNRQDHYHWEIP